MNSIENAYELAYQHLPEKWYESEPLRFAVYIIAFVTIWMTLQESGIEHTDLARYASVVCYVIGTVLDTYSTEQAFSMSQKTEIQGLAPVTEKSPYLSVRPSKQELYDLRRNPLDIILCILAYLVPALGINIGLLRLIAMKNNRRVTKRLALTLKLSGHDLSFNSDEGSEA